MTSALAVEEARKNLVRKRPGWLAAFEARPVSIEVVPSVLFPLPVELEERTRALRGHSPPL